MMKAPVCFGEVGKKNPRLYGMVCFPFVQFKKHNQKGKKKAAP